MLRVRRKLLLFRSDADLQHVFLGSARRSHPEEYDRVLTAMRAAGVEVVFRPGEYAYSPAIGGPGRLILDADASLGALRHEYRHFLDIRDAGYPGLGYYLMNAGAFARLEIRGYHEEIRIARTLGNAALVQAIRSQMRHRVDEVFGR